jgi:hypothetical protein
LAALKSASVAVLRMSPHFLGSDVIAKDELPPLLATAEPEGLAIISIAVSASLYEATVIGRYQAPNDPSRPPGSLDPAALNRELTRFAGIIHRAAKNTERNHP